MLDLKRIENKSPPLVIRRAYLNNPIRMTLSAIWETTFHCASLSNLEKPRRGDE